MQPQRHPVVTADHSGPCIIAYDGSPASDRAVAAARILSIRRAVVVHVWKPEVAFEIAQPSIPPASSTSVAVERMLADAASELVRRGARIARSCGFETEVLAVTKDATVAATLCRVANEYNSVAIVVGAHGHRRMHEVLVGSTVRELLRKSPCPVVVAPQYVDQQSD
jgi:nucleotide-binding universal stress UspA family protein